MAKPGQPPADPMAADLQTGTSKSGDRLMTINRSSTVAPRRVIGANVATITRIGRAARMSPSTCYWLLRAGLCVAYIYSGVSKLSDFQGAIAEQAQLGISPPTLFAGATIATQLVGSALILFARGIPAALGAALLAGFTVVATPLGHPFWDETGFERYADLNAFVEHFGLIAGFALTVMIETGWIAKVPRRSA
jgi:transmembrane protein